MKRNVWVNHFLGAVFAFGLSVSTVGCLVTGFDLWVRSMASIVVCCGILSLLCSLLYRLKYGGMVHWCLFALALVYLWNRSPLWDQVQTLVCRITLYYHNGYGWPVLGAKLSEELDLALMLLAWLTASGVSYYVCRRRFLIMALVSAVFPLAACLVVTNTVPDGGYLYLLILGVGLLLATDWVRRHHLAQSITLTLRLAVPVAAALALLFWLNPQDGYVNNAKQMQEQALAWLQQFQTTAEEVTGSVVSEAVISQRVNLRTLGARSRLSFPVMRVSAPVHGTLYLRGQDFDVYTGEGWTSTLNRTERFGSGEDLVGEITIATYGPRSILYVPYYPAESISFSNGSLDNDADWNTYQFQLALNPAGDGTRPGSGYTELPESTLQWAGPLVDEIILGNTTQTEQVQAIREYVRNSAPYNLNTARMPRGAEDFAQWFLEESETGYCVHFATAATVLLRAAGIPARYVEGYMFSAVAGEEVVVTNQAAHAWAEYYDYDESAWKVLEATPPDESGEAETTVPETTDTLPTEPTETTPSASRPSQTEQIPGKPTPGQPEQIQPEEPFEFPQWAKNLAKIILWAALLILQGELRITWKRKQWNRGEPNEMALTRWKQARRLAGMLKMPLPEGLEMLAQKAKFSQHTLTPEELQQFDLFRHDAVQSLSRKPAYQRWFLRWILAIG